MMKVTVKVRMKARTTIHELAQAGGVCRLSITFLPPPSIKHLYHEHTDVELI